MIETIALPSPNHDERPAGLDVDMLVLHYTGMRSGADALDRLRDPVAKVSAHYVIEEDGRIFRLVDETRRAWHAGVSCWRGMRDVNARSIGIELVNPGHEFGYRDFPAVQMHALITLARDIIARYPIPARNVVGHSDVAPSRKTDPGERFDWEALARSGIGLWPPRMPARHGACETYMLGDSDAAVRTAQDLLAEYGYDVPRSGQLDEATSLVLAAFQRHFRPEAVDGFLDPETMARLEALVAHAIKHG